MFRLIKNLIVLAIVFFLGYFFGIKGIRFFKVVSSSMEPTLNIEDKIISEKTENIKRKDIVVLYAPTGKREVLVKRVIGLPGEKIKIEDGYVYIDGKILEEPYIMEKPVYELEEIEIPFDSYFLLGDNRNASEDSSIWGPVNKKNIIGKVILRYSPLKNFKIF